MKRLIIIIVVVSFTSILGYKLYNNQKNIYFTELPKNYEDFEKNLFPVFQKIKPEEKILLLNYSIRYMNSPKKITVKEAIDDEKSFENTSDGLMFFNKLKGKEINDARIKAINNSIFITYVDYVMNDNDNTINIIFSIKNKTSDIITLIEGDAIFTIGSDNFQTSVVFSPDAVGNDVTQITKVFKFSEFPNLKDFNQDSAFKMNVHKIVFNTGKVLNN